MQGPEPVIAEPILATTGGCDGDDRHALSLPPSRAMVHALGGVALILLSAVLHHYGRSLGAGIVLLLLPLVTVFSVTWVDGPYVYYRRFGPLRRLPLAEVTAVGTSRPRSGTPFLTLSAPSLSKPLRIAVRSRWFTLPRDAREHLRLRLDPARVRWDPGAIALLDDRSNEAPGARRRQSRMRLALGVVLPVVVVALALFVSIERNAAHAIPGAPGYHTFTGESGKPLPIGRPWGTACQPVRFTVEQTVPDWIYDAAVAVVNEARQDGIDVAIETRAFMWTPSSLYYVPGQSPATTKRVGIFASGDSPPSLDTGGREHIELGWDTQPDADGIHDDLVDAQGVLYLQALGNDPAAARLAIRQLVAMTQGIIRTSADGSGIARGSNADRFSTDDVTAMKVMSGCATAG